MVPRFFTGWLFCAVIVSACGTYESDNATLERGYGASEPTPAQRPAPRRPGDPAEDLAEAVEDAAEQAAELDGDELGAGWLEATSNLSVAGGYSVAATGACEETPGSFDYCGSGCICGENEGDCDGDAECASGLICMRDTGGLFGFDPEVDVCMAQCAPDALGTPDFCSPECPCDAGEADCDDDEDCAPGNICAKNVGTAFGYAADVDVCVDICDSILSGDWDFCSPECPCTDGQADCDRDEDCAPGHACTSNVGANYGFPADMDVCVRYVTCSDGIQNGDETGLDCGGTVCAPCNPDPGPPQGVPVEPEGTSLLIQVVGPDGAPIAGATVRVGDVEQTTDAQGNALFENLAAGARVVQVSAPGFASGAFAAELEPGAHGGTTASLNPLGPPIAFDADTDATVVTEEVAVDIPAGSLVDENGFPVTGTAEIAFAPIDPTSDDIISSPGSFVGISATTGEAVDLESGFMAEISLTQNGRPLQLAQGATAAVTFTLPPDFAAQPGELIQAWWFDTEAGVWHEDGLGLVEESPTEPGRLIWTVEVSHFTSWNCDRPWYTRSCADVLVTDQEGRPLAGRTITARGLSYGYRGTALTQANGRACVPVMKDGFAKISVGPEWEPLAWQNITPTAVASCGSSSCTQVTLTVPVPCGSPGTTQACTYTGRPGTEGVGACQAGYRVCDGFDWGPCTDQVTPSAEICENTIDEDCDGQLNDGCPVCDEGSTQACYTGPAGTEGIGVCRAGVRTCVNGTWGVCAGQVKPTASEICGNSHDDDCDGLTSEGCTCVPGEVQECYTGPAGTEGIGLCQAGTRTCFGRFTQVFWGACAGQVMPVSEVCDGQDNDCTGQSDDGNPGGGADCSTGQPGVCLQGTVTCSGGALVCMSDTAASPEVCDALDNDCDGQSDENNPGGGAFCDTGIPGICAAGTMICQADGLTCVQNQAAVPEDCNTSADDDCDGQANEDCNTGISYYNYSASNTASATQNTYNHPVTIPGGRTITIGTCGLPDVWANGDTYLRLYNPAGQQVALNDDACGSLSTYLMYTVPANAGGTYTIRSGCYSSQSCSGRVGYTF